MILASSRRLQLTLVTALAGAFGLSILLQAAPSVPSNTWAAASSMLGARAGAAAALLPDGGVLVTGGMGAAGVTASVERYSPTTNGFVATPSLQGARAYHTATTLRDGRVLVTGGAGADGWGLASAEIYDPVANAWAAAGSMSHPRAGHTATLLRDGSVLVAGGRDNTTPTDTLELFDPESGTFSNLADTLTAPRSEHAAALLRDGRVLIAGGFDGTNVLASVNLYNPDDDRVTAGAPMSTVRSAHTATTLLDGRVLVLGGMTLVSEIGMAELYDPAANTFTFAGNSARRQRHSAILLPHNNTVLIVGGYDRDRIAPVETYTPWQTGGTFVVAPGPAVGRAWGTATALSVPASDSVRTGPNDGLLLLAGGSASSTGAPPVANADLYGFATVTTDKDDYLRDQVVTVTGGGWQPGESVTLRFEESPVVHLHPTIHVTANSTGHISTTAFVVDTHTTGVTFTLTATGTKSEARTMFTDSSNAIRLGMTRTPTPNPVEVGMPFLTRIAVQDISGATVTTSTAAITLSSPDGVLTGATPHSATAGIAGFTNLTFPAPGQYHLLATSPGLQSLQVTVDVVAAATATTLTSSINPSQYEQELTFTATVVPVGSGVPTGTVTFLDGATTLGTATLSAGVATLHTTALTLGPRSITAVFAGNTSFVTSTSPALTQVVDAAATTMRKGSRAGSTVFGQDVSWTVSVTQDLSDTGSPTGTVQLYDDGVAVGGAGTLSSEMLDVTAGSRHTCAVTAGGGVVCWGLNDDGQLGDGTTTDRRKLGPVTGISNVTAIAAGANHTCALTSAGAVRCWGWPNSHTAVPVAGLSTGVQAIAAGAEHTCALTTLGGVWCWGNNENEQLGNSSVIQFTSTPVPVAGLSSGVTAIAAGREATCAVMATGGVKCWGHLLFSWASEPATIGGLANVRAIAVGDGHWCALMTGGSVKCWGWNSDGQVGNGEIGGSVPGPLTVQGLSDVETIDAGANYTCVVTRAGAAKCWGANSTYQLGNGTKIHSPTPVDVVGLSSGVRLIATGELDGYHTCALTTTGTVKCWGLNIAGEIGDGTVTTRVSPTMPLGAAASLTLSGLSIGAHPITAVYGGDTLRQGSTVSATQTVDRATTITSVTASPSVPVYGQAVTLDATVSVPSPGAGVPTGLVTFKDGSTTIATAPLDELSHAAFVYSLPSMGPHSITAVYAGDSHFKTSTSQAVAYTVALATTVTSITASPVVVVGELMTFTATVTIVSPGSGVPAGTVTFNDDSTMIGSGTVDTSGHATFSTSSLSPGVHPIVAVYSGNTFYAPSTSSTLTKTVHPKSTSTVATSIPSPSVSGQRVAVSAAVTTGPGLGPPTGTVQFRDNGAPIGGPIALMAGEPVAAAGSSHTCVVTPAGGVVCWGSNTDGQLGDGTTTIFVSPPRTVSGLSSGVVAVATGAKHTCAVTTTGGVLCWGANDSGQIGDGGLASRSTPVSVSRLSSGVATVAAGRSHTCALTTAGAVLCWGDNQFGQLGDGTTTDRVTPVEVISLSSGVASIAAGEFDVCALTNSGALRCWGANAHGQLGDGTTTDRSTPVAVSDLSSDVIAVGAGGGHTCALTSAGGVQCWGLNLSGQLGDGTTTDRAVPGPVSGLSNGVSAMVTGLNHTCAVATGAVLCWGANTTFQLGNGPGIKRSTPVAVSGLSSGVQSITAGYGHTCAVMIADEVLCWGEDRSQTVAAATPVGIPSLNLAVAGAGLPPSTPATGSHVITAEYSGAAAFNPSTSPAYTYTVNKAAAAVSTATSVTPSVIGQAVTFTVTVSAVAPGSGTPAGTVRFKDGPTGQTLLGVVTLDASGHATLTTPALSVGAHVITAYYDGDANFTDTATAPISLTQTVNQASTTATLTSSKNPAAYGETVTLAATIVASAPNSAVPTGTVIFNDGSETLGTATLDALGVATLTTSSLLPGGQTITAIYAGDTNFTGSTAPALIQTVNQAETATTLTSSLTPSSFGEVVTFTATVSAASPGDGTPTGTVVFRQGTLTLGTGTLDASRQATFTTASLLAGDASMTATYDGDANFAASTSPALTQTVNQGNTTTMLATSITAAAFGQPVTFTATVSPTLAGVALPGGTVTFKQGDATLWSGPLDDVRQATFTTSSLPIGSLSISAVYDGDANFTGSTSSPLAQVVDKAETITEVSSSLNPSVIGQPVTFTATVRVISPGSGTPGGTVEFTHFGTVLGTATLDASGQAMFTTSSLPLSSFGTSIEATYLGDSRFTSSAAELFQVVDRKTTTTSLTSSSSGPTAFGDPLTFTATVTTAPENGIPTGGVYFLDGSTTLANITLVAGEATFTTSALSGGARTITAAYIGNLTLAPSTSPALTQTVIPLSTTTSVTTSLSPSVVGQTITLTATVVGPGAAKPNGTVTFMNSGTPMVSRTLNASGQASYTTTDFSVASHSITVVYAGNANFVTSTSPVVQQVVTKISTTTSLASSLNPATLGEPVTLTATVNPVAPGSGNPTGTVTFKDGSITLGTATLDTREATLTTSSLSAGAHAITAVYAGQGNFATSTSAALTETIAKFEQTITFAVPAGRTYGDPDFPVSATASSGLTVSFTAAGGCTVNGTTVHITAAESCTITAAQGGDQTRSAAPNVAQTFSIAKAVASVIANNAQRSYWDPLPLLTGTVAGLVNGDPIAVSYTTTAVADSPAGSYLITPALSDPQGRLANYTVQLTPATLTVLNPAPHLTLADPASAGAGDLELLVTLTGDGFVPQSVAHLGGLTLDTEFVSATSLRAVIPASSLVTSGVRYLTVVNAAPGGGTSSPSAFFVNDTGAPVESTSTGTVTGGTTTVVTGGEAAGTPDTLTAVVSGSGTVTVAQYDGNPTEPTGFSNSGGYFDVFVAPGSTLTTLVVTTCDLNGGTSILWYTGTAWQPVQPQAFNAATGCVTMNLASAGTSPTIGQLTGTYFAAVAPEAVTPGAIFGSGRIQTGTTRNWFDFSVRERASGADRGRLRIESRTPATGKGKKHVAAQRNRFVTDALTNVVFSDDAATKPGKKPKVTTDTVVFSGTGRFNGRSGYRFEATAVDRGEPGRNRDSLTIVIRDTAGVVVLTIDDTIDRGNIQSTRVRK